jgi:YHS domain-containing protein/copper chaperone CopZ
MTQTTLNIPDITCDHCERTITTALKPLEGVQSVAVDIPAKQVQLEFDAERVDLERIKAILEEEYYPVASIAGSGQTTMKENVPVADTLKTTAIDPVCGMSVDTQTARLTADYEGQTYYFCAPGCQRTFKADPQRYLAADNQEPSGGCSCCAPSA